MGENGLSTRPRGGFGTTLLLAAIGGLSIGHASASELSERLFHAGAPPAEPNERHAEHRATPAPRGAGPGLASRLFASVAGYQGSIAGPQGPTPSAEAEPPVATIVYVDDADRTTKAAAKARPASYSLAKPLPLTKPPSDARSSEEAPDAVTPEERDPILAALAKHPHEERRIVSPAASAPLDEVAPLLGDAESNWRAGLIATGAEAAPRRVVANPIPLLRTAQVNPFPSAPELIAPPQAIEKAAKPGRATDQGRRPSRPANDRLRRSPLALGIETGPPARLVEQMAKTPDNFKIKNHAQTAFGAWEAPSEEITQRPMRYPMGSVVSWAAPSVCHRPLYFEQPNLERYGHQCRLGKKHGWGLPSAISAAHFFGTIPALPYLVGAEGGLCSGRYSLGAYRPGSCNPHRKVLPPMSLRGLAFEGAAATGLVFLVP